MKNCTLLIKHGNLFQIGNDLDIAISGDRILQIGRNLNYPDVPYIDASNRLISASFVDSHTHLDKALSAVELNAEGLGEAIAQSRAFQDSVPLEKVRENVKERASQILRWEASHGSCAIKSHVLMDEKWGMEALYALNELKEEYKDLIRVLNITPYHPEYDKEWRAAASSGEIDFIAGYPGCLGTDTYAEEADEMFALAEQYDLPLDLHVNEADAADLRAFEYVLKKTEETGLGNRVTCGHVTGMNAVSDEQAAEDIAWAKELGINIITLPSCNMYLMGRNDHQPIRRGLTRVTEFLKAGVNISYASDNIRDHFRPYGNGNMCEEALFTAQCIQYGTTRELTEVLKMGTENPAKNCLLKDYGLKEGCIADLMIFREPTVNQAIISNSPRLFVLKNGKVIARDGALLDL